MLSASIGCGFGTYDDSASPGVTSASDGVADSGMWWPWVCPSGTNPSPASTPLSYTAAGTCGAGGPFTLSVDGCIISGTWSSLGLTDDTQTLQPTSTPNLGGWIVSGTPLADADDDGGAPTWNCTASIPDASGVLTVVCTDATTMATTCQSTLTPVSAP